MAASSSGRVRINVGGKVFETSRATLEQGGDSFLLLPMISPFWAQQQQQQLPGDPPPEVFVDRDPKLFRVLLSLLRTGLLDVPPDVSLPALIHEADYFGLLDHLKAALLPRPLDGHELERASCIQPNVGAHESCTAMAAQPDGSIDVAHGKRITCYDWSLRRTCTIITDLPQVDAIQRLSDTHLAAGGSRSGDALAVYDVRSGLRSATVACRGSHAVVRALAASDDLGLLFVASLRKTLGLEWGVEKAVGVLDRRTLQLVGEAGASPVTTRRLGGPDKLQWLPAWGLLLVVKRFGDMARSDGPTYARLWDPRSNALVWDWREFDQPHEVSRSQRDPIEQSSAVGDATVSEELSLLYKVAPCRKDLRSSLSLLDLRMLSSAAHDRRSVVTVSGDGEDAGGSAQWSLIEGSSEPSRPASSIKREARSIKLVTVPRSNHVLCNIQQRLEVWRPLVAKDGGGGSSSSLSSGEGGDSPFPTFSRSFACNHVGAQGSRPRFSPLPYTDPEEGWIYDMAVGGHRLFVARDATDRRSAIEVWETK
eukprot:jgi/Mesen1/2584/ME000164S01707